MEIAPNLLNSTLNQKESETEEKKEEEGLNDPEQHVKPCFKTPSHVSYDCVLKRSCAPNQVVIHMLLQYYMVPAPQRELASTGEALFI